ncbi:MAG: tRNA uridine-5-carboxymethylaminomethyl(34) synthesis GTPase MnmE [Saprospiraceae bacterium]|nr:tRNA uridine-5-carboxymethylaminomethyl(34) synthesis GTPase MnmE [Saprospiraceae bacterium]
MYQQVDLADTIVALATAAGMGAIAVIRLSGKEAINIVNQVFPSKDLTQVDSHTIHLGYIKDEMDKRVDQVLVSVFKTPKSYTKENVVEVSCHGSTYIQQQLIELFLRKGARMAKRGEFTLRAFLNGQLDLSQAEAVADLISADSASSHDLAMKQMRGGFSKEIQHLRERLIHFASLIELELDFGEEDVEFADRQDLKDLVETVQGLIKRLLDSFQLGNVIKHGVHTVIAGRPNAGKSTLLNALLNEERAIVSNIAGTTRDTIEETLNINGVQFRLIDTAGIREATDQIEAIGIEKTMQEIQRSSIVVYVYDALRMDIPDVIEDLNKLGNSSAKLLVIANKLDELEALHDNAYNQLRSSQLEKGWLDLIKPYQEKYPFINLSAKKKTALDQLKDKLYSTVLSADFSTENTIVSNSRHYDVLQKAQGSLDDVLMGLANGISGDFLAMDIRHALRALGEITGEISTDDLLDNIFRNFCIGK